MQDYTFLDDYDYTFCGNCRSSIQPYDNTSITTITSSIIKTTEKDETLTEMTTIKVTKQILSSTNSFTELLIKYHHLHCQKCGLYIEIHPKYDDDTSSKIFICSNSDNNNPHKYCLCYHCGLLYGINPNQKSIDIINILQHKIDNMQKESELEKERKSKEDGEPNTDKINTEREEIEIENVETVTIKDDDDEEDEEENSLDLEVNDDSDHIPVDDEEDDDKLSKENEISRKNSIDESYLNILALKEKLSNIHVSSHSDKTVSCPTSPNGHNTTSNKFGFNHLPKSLKGSPLLGPSTPSPRTLGQDNDEMIEWWQQYKESQIKEKDKTIKQNLNKKLEEQQSQIERLQQLLNKAKNNKNNAKNCASIFRRGAYSNKINLINNNSNPTKLES